MDVLDVGGRFKPLADGEGEQRELNPDAAPPRPAVGGAGSPGGIEGGVIPGGGGSREIDGSPGSGGPEVQPGGAGAGILGDFKSSGQFLRFDLQSRLGETGGLPGGGSEAGTGLSPGGVSAGGSAPPSGGTGSSTPSGQPVGGTVGQGHGIADGFGDHAGGAGAGGGASVVRLPEESWNGPENLSGDLQKQWYDAQREASADVSAEQVDQMLNAKMGTGITDNETSRGYLDAAQQALDDALNDPGGDTPEGAGDPDIAEALGEETPDTPESANGTSSTGDDDDTSTDGADDTEEAEPVEQAVDDEDPPSGDSVDGDGRSGAPRGYFLPGGPGGPALGRTFGGDPETDPNRDTGQRERLPGEGQGVTTGGSQETDPESDTGHKPKVFVKTAGPSQFDPEGFDYNEIDKGERAGQILDQLDGKGGTA